MIKKINSRSRIKVVLSDDLRYKSSHLIMQYKFSTWWSKNHWTDVAKVVMNDHSAEAYAKKIADLHIKVNDLRQVRINERKFRKELAQC